MQYKKRVIMDKLEKITDKIQTARIGAKHLGIGWLQGELANLVGKQCSCYDSKIDDGADDDETEDSYVMKDCFEFEDSPLTVRVYYGDVTREIGYVDVSES